MRRTGPLDAAFLGLEGPGYPLHTMAVMVLDPATAGRYSLGRRCRLSGAASRASHRSASSSSRSVEVTVRQRRPESTSTHFEGIALG